MFVENIKNEIYSVLIVDDNQGFLELIVLYLGNAKYKMEIFTARSAAEALALLKEKRFDIIVSDYLMPEMNGLEFFQEARKDYKIPFILLTGTDNQEIILKAINLGVDGYIQKGGNISNRFEELIAQIQKTVSDYQMREECHSVLKNAPVGIFHSSPEGELISANQKMAEIMGCSDSEELINSFSNIEFAYNDNAQKKELIDSLLENEKGWLNFDQVCLRKKDNQEIFVKLTIRSVRNSKNKIAYLEGFVEDVTELKEANDRIELMSKTIRHDIGNELTILLMNTELVKMDISNPAFDKYFERIESAGTSIKKQIDFMKLYQEIGSQKPDWLDLYQKIPKISKPEIINLMVEIPKGLKIYSDLMIEKVFDNLLDNSVRHGEKVSKIKVTATPMESELMIVWEDNGIGVSSENKENIFKQGFGKNTGLGLYLIRKILGLTGIKIQETGEFQKGARFEILVPKEKYKILED
ncbi:MAG: response regulator [Candidatus Paceibacterota bacterium]